MKEHGYADDDDDAPATDAPTAAPLTEAPTRAPSNVPTLEPTAAPSKTTAAPTAAPSLPPGRVTEEGVGDVDAAVVFGSGRDD